MFSEKYSLYPPNCSIEGDAESRGHGNYAGRIRSEFSFDARQWISSPIVVNCEIEYLKWGVADHLVQQDQRQSTLIVHWLQCDGKTICIAMTLNQNLFFFWHLYNAFEKKKKRCDVSCCQRHQKHVCLYDAIDKLDSWGGTEHILTDNILWPHAYDDSPVRIQLSRDQTWCNIWKQYTAVHSHCNHRHIVQWHKILLERWERVQT